MTSAISAEAPRRAARPLRGDRAELPRVRIVVLTYNAGAFIDRCLGAVLATDYPSFEVTVVDNASSDGSVLTLNKDFPDITLLEAGANLGFARGNNLAMRGASAPYIALLNPDTEVDPDWLRPLVERLQADPIAGGVGPKILFSDDRLEVNLRSSTFLPPGNDGRTLGVRIYEHSDSAAQAVFNGGVYGPELDSHGATFRWTDGGAALAIPIVNGEAHTVLDVSADGRQDDVAFSVGIGDQELWTRPVTTTRTQFSLNVPAELTRRFARPAIENAGIKPLPDGSMRDRGTYVTHGNVWQAWDGLEFGTAREVFAVKGGAALYRRSMLESLDFLDPGIFMYYEDADLAWRARRRGWRFWYEPASVVRHAHAALSVEWSPRFVRNVEFGKLRMLGKNAPWAWTRHHAGLAAVHGAREFRNGLPEISSRAAARARARSLSLRDALKALPATLRLRRVERRLAPLDGRELEPFYELE